MRKTVFASDVFEAVTIYRKALEDKFGSLDGKMLIVKVEERAE